MTLRLTLVTLFFLTTISFSDEVAVELFVPRDDMASVMEAAAGRVLLERGEYEKLLSEAGKVVSDAPSSPVDFVLLNCEVRTEIVSGEAHITAVYDWDVLTDKTVAVPLTIDSLTILSATLDGKPARIGCDKPVTLYAIAVPQQQPLAQQQAQPAPQQTQHYVAPPTTYTVFLTGRGQRRLVLEMTSPLFVNSVRQELHYQLTLAPKTVERLLVSGDVELRSGATVVARNVTGDGLARKTSFELVPLGNKRDLVLTLNSHRDKTTRSILTRSVQTATVSEYDEKLSAAFSVNIIHQGVEQLEFLIPNGFEIDSAKSPLMLRWSVRENAANKILNIVFRESVTGIVNVELSAIREFNATESEWRFPFFAPLNVTADSSVLELQVDSRLSIRSLNNNVLIPLTDNRTIANSSTQPNNGSPNANEQTKSYRKVAAFYAPRPIQIVPLTAKFERPAATFETSTKTILTVKQEMLVAVCSFVITPQIENVYSLQIQIPQHWKVTKVYIFGNLVPFEVKTGIVYIQLPQGLPVGQNSEIFLTLSGEAPGWFGDWQEQKLPMPNVRVLDAAREAGSIIIATDDDLALTVETDEQIVPLDKQDSHADKQAAVAFEGLFTEQPYKCDLTITRRTPRMTARTFAFYRFAPNLLNASYEIHYTIHEANAKTLAFLLPESTPENVTITGFRDDRYYHTNNANPNVNPNTNIIKESTSKLVEVDGKQYRRWEALLTEPASGALRLRVNFQQSIKDNETGLELPRVVAESVAWQSELIAIEGHEELDVAVKSERELKLADIGELSPARYETGRRLLGVYGGLAANEPLRVAVKQNQALQLTPSIIRLASSEVMLTNDGRTVNKTVYHLKTRGTYIRVELPRVNGIPDGLWSATLDGEVVRPQLASVGLPLNGENFKYEMLLDQIPKIKSILIDLSSNSNKSSDENMEHVLEIVWASNNSGELVLPNIAVQVKSDSPERDWQIVPVLEVKWYLTAPDGFKPVITSRKTEMPSPLLLRLAQSCINRYNEGGFNLNFGCSSRVAGTPALSVSAAAPEVEMLDELTVGISESVVAGMDTDVSAGKRGLGNNRSSADAGRQLSREVVKVQGRPGHVVQANTPLNSDQRSSEYVFEQDGRGRLEYEYKAPGKVVERDTSNFTRRGFDVTSYNGTYSEVQDKWDAGYRQFKSVQPVRVDYQQRVVTNDFSREAIEAIGTSGVSRLTVRLVDYRLIAIVAALVWLGVLIVGVSIVKWSARCKYRYLLFAYVIGTLTVLVPTLEHFASIGDNVVHAALLLTLFYCVVGIFKKFSNSVKRCFATIPSNVIVISSVQTTTDVTTTAILLFTIILTTLNNAIADEPTERPINLPKDAVVVFYDVADLPKSFVPTGELPKSLIDPTENAKQKLLVPYSQYVELWNKANPDKPRPAIFPPRDEHPYSITNAIFSATLGAVDELSVTGSFDVETQTGKIVIVNLPVLGGVLRKMTVDGKPAKLTLDEKQNNTNEFNAGGLFLLALDNNVQDNTDNNADKTTTVARKIEFEAVFRVTRQGGWRLVRGVLPKMPVQEVALKLTDPQTELRCAGILGRQKWDSSQANNQNVPATTNNIARTSLGNDGRFQWSWRSQVTEAEIDHSLTANSELRWNIQENATTLSWDATLAFGRGKQETVRLRVPNDYTVLSLTGDNVRGWEVTESNKETFVDVELLSAAAATELIHVLMFKKDDEVDGDKKLDAPNVDVVGAAMHRGRLQIARSTLYTVRATELANLSPTELANDHVLTVPNGGTHIGAIYKLGLFTSPLSVTPFQAYRFSTEDYKLTLNVERTKHGIERYTIQSVYTVGQREIKMMCRLTSVIGNSIQTLTLRVPPDVRVDNLTSVFPMEYSQRKNADGSVDLFVIFPNGFNVGTANSADKLILNATMLVSPDKIMNNNNSNARADGVKLPIVVVLDAKNTEQFVALQTYPAFDIEIRDLKGFTKDEVIAARPETPANNSMLRRNLLGTGNDTTEISATLALNPRSPKITAESITNVKLTGRSIEETLLLSYDIQNAGVRAIRFTLPETIADARIDAPLLRRKIVGTKDTDGRIPVTLELHDEVMGEFRVLIQGDRLLLPGQQYQASIPVLTNVEMQRQFVVLENSGGQDEMIVDAAKLRGMRKLSRQQQEWRTLETIFGAGATEAYIVVDNNDLSSLTFEMLQRQTIKMSGATIGLSETRFVIGENGDYRAEQIYRIDNKSEQYLDLMLPDGAELWVIRLLNAEQWATRELQISSGYAAKVDDTPLKPTLMEAGAIAEWQKITGTEAMGRIKERFVRVPLVKTEVGNLDDIIRIVYAGSLGKLSLLNESKLPFLKVRNVPIELSMVKLYLPKNNRYQFDGTMTPIDNALYNSSLGIYKRKVESKLEDVLQRGNPFEKQRAVTNMLINGKLQQQSQSAPLERGEETQQMPQVQKPRRGNPQGMEQNIDGSPFVVSGMVNSPQSTGAEEQRDAQSLSNFDQMQNVFSNQQNSRAKNSMEEVNEKIKPKGVYISGAIGEITFDDKTSFPQRKREPLSKSSSESNAYSNSAPVEKSERRTNTDVDGKGIMPGWTILESDKEQPQQPIPPPAPQFSPSSGGGNGGAIHMGSGAISIGGGAMSYRGGGAISGNDSAIILPPNSNITFTPPTNNSNEKNTLTQRFVSLDIDIPYEGELYQFKSPQETEQLSFRTINKDNLKRTEAMATLLAIVAIITILRFATRKWRQKPTV